MSEAEDSETIAANGASDVRRNSGSMSAAEDEEEQATQRRLNEERAAQLVTVSEALRQAKARVAQAELRFKEASAERAAALSGERRLKVQHNARASRWSNDDAARAAQQAVAEDNVTRQLAHNEQAAPFVVEAPPHGALAPQQQRPPPPCKLTWYLPLLLKSDQ